MKIIFRMPAEMKKMMEDLAKLEKEGIDDIAWDMVKAGSDVALEGMRRRVPVRKVGGGRLKSYVRRTPIKRSGNRVYTEIGLVDAPADVLRYGTAQEFGTRKHGAQSFVRSTMKEDRAKINLAMRNVLKSRLGGNR